MSGGVLLKKRTWELGWQINAVPTFVGLDMFLKSGRKLRYDSKLQNEKVSVVLYCLRFPIALGLAFPIPKTDSSPDGIIEGGFTVLRGSRVRNSRVLSELEK